MNDVTNAAGAPGFVRRNGSWSRGAHCPSPGRGGVTYGFLGADERFLALARQKDRLTVRSDVDVGLFEAEAERRRGGVECPAAAGDARELSRFLPIRDRDLGPRDARQVVAELALAREIERVDARRDSFDGRRVDGELPV